ncbi:MAG: hypothetical protein US86_C0013G0023 [Candidatus Daviesbacteria bacterium GW2011_GWA2_38_24]|uniref:Uncharacterized protein n=1 Tax=Candidatus Daviesbacteria bacterium GW2011_GWA2_38_24 TaxID=1618422 RepID=A0A0G0JE88_9BACT|nr:MAG: hypothetical protein US86_C0013G0023 [Candidatus Daviesbacteria bacterium GW2011_GWA2_38_24]KKQ79885.1 MAG: hypothetical protein UT01_C0025G0018 [Candidatus Daviesbacteria bacterium GW2011_GWA1_38_7]OGE23084.1 MAG: hypothetical protein A2688_03745 [Candidatus Daviesbacteria bacterium RIFCSPHIGHO2_01_FULL_38_8]
MNTTLVKVVVAALISVFLYNIFLFGVQLGVGTGLLFLGLNIYFFVAREKKNENLSLAISASAASIVFAFLFAFRDNDVVQVVNFLAAVFFSLTALYLYKFTGSFSFQVPRFILLPILILKDFVVSLYNLAKPDTWSSSKQIDKNITTSLFRGIAIASALFLILFFLLSQADPIFNKLSQNFFASIRERTITSVVIFVALTGFGLIKILEKATETKLKNELSVGKLHELSIITGSISALFLVFIIVQFRYLFSAVNERDLHQLGINSLTYSEYVRKGFFELIIVAALSSGIVIYALKFLHRFKDNQKRLIQIFSGFLTIETGLLLLSAVKRVALYADAHGLTRARIFGFVFLLWLSVMLSIFLFRIFKETGKKNFFYISLLSTLITLLFINILNIDGLVATKYKPTVNNEVDYFYLTGLSSDAVDVWKEALVESEKTLVQLETVKSLNSEDNRKLYWTRLTLDQIRFDVEYLVEKYSIQRKWQSYNLSEYLAYQKISEDAGFLEKVKDLLTRANVLESRVSDEVRFSTQLDRSVNPPLVR